MSGTRSLSAALNFVLQGTYKTVLADGLETLPFPFLAQVQDAIANGNSGALTSNRMWMSTGRILGSGSSETFDLSSFTGFDIGMGAGNDPSGAAAGFSAITVFWVVNYPTSAGTLVLGNDASGAEWISITGVAGVFAKIPPQGKYPLIFDGATSLAVASGTNAKLKVLASGGACTYDFLAIGRL